MPKKNLDKIKKLFILLLFVNAAAFIIFGIYLTNLIFPQPFYSHKLDFDNISIYSDEELPQTETISLLQNVQNRIKTSEIYSADFHQNIFITNNQLLWIYFTPLNWDTAGLNNPYFSNIFIRKADIVNNKLSTLNRDGFVSGNRTLDYYLAHEMTHSLEFQKIGWTYVFTRNFTIVEGYCEYIGHGSEKYEDLLNYYLNVPENSTAKSYTKARTVIAYLIQKKNMNFIQIWNMQDKVDNFTAEAIPHDNPKIDDSIAH